MQRFTFIGSPSMRDGSISVIDEFAQALSSEFDNDRTRQYFDVMRMRILSASGCRTRFILKFSKFFL